MDNSLRSSVPSRCSVGNVVNKHTETRTPSEHAAGWLGDASLVGAKSRYHSLRGKDPTEITSIPPSKPSLTDAAIASENSSSRARPFESKSLSACKTSRDPSH